MNFNVNFKIVFKDSSIVHQLVDKKNFDNIKMQQHGVCVEIKEYIYASSPPLGLRGLLWGEFYLYCFLRILGRISQPKERTHFDDVL
jgi:hypothetical protein